MFGPPWHLYCEAPKGSDRCCCSISTEEVFMWGNPVIEHMLRKEKVPECWCVCVCVSTSTHLVTEQRRCHLATCLLSPVAPPILGLHCCLALSVQFLGNICRLLCSVWHRSAQEGLNTARPHGVFNVSHVWCSPCNVRFELVATHRTTHRTGCSALVLWIRPVFPLSLKALIFVQFLACFFFFYWTLRPGWFLKLPQS